MEEWRPVVGYEGRYEVSNEGRVRSYCERGGHYRILPTSHEMRQSRMGRYRGVALCDGVGKARKTYVHRMVMGAFGGSRPSGCEVRHLDGDRLNNRIDNLAWGTRAENMQDMVRHGRTQRGEKFYGTHLTDLDVVHIRQLAEAGMPRGELALMYGLSAGGIHHIVSRERWAHVA